MSVRRPAYLVAGLALTFLVLAPLTSIDAAQQAGLPLLTDKLWFRIATTVAMFVVMASAWNIIGGLTGYASFGNVAFFGLGAYTAGVVVSNLNLPFALALVLAPLVAAAFAVIVGIPLLRLRGHYFAVATLGVGVAVGEVVNNIEPLGAATGLFLPIIRSDLLFFYLMLGAALLAVLTTWVILRTRFGYGLLAIRENEEAAAVIGVNTTFYKVAAFCIAAALTGIAGAIFAQWNSFINQDNAGRRGGLARADHPDAGWRRLRLGVLSDRPRCLARRLRHLHSARRDRLLRRPKQTLAALFPADVTRDQRMSLLAIRDVSKRFGGVNALAGVTFEVEQGDILGIIGPNGAGKTTLLNCISGLYRPDAGDIRWETASIRGLAPYRIARLGIGRTFQIVRPFPSMTVRENTAMGALFGRPGARLQPGAALNEADTVLDVVGLGEKRHYPVLRLTVPDRKRLEVARALAMRPRLLLLDEVMAGLNQVEIEQALEMVRRVRDSGVTIVLIEHVMKVIVGVCRRALVLNFGRTLLEGPPAEVLKDRRVIEAYLGQRYAKDHEK
ncbi:MAG: branched-chain amino acid ABC transporter ATP-binding protein/permease [Chloroflexi bacterium]|nr:MAG: branched-chain amino acid ABC transporter ATP-binding protein/permease [Chloroflexota bacterium]